MRAKIGVPHNDRWAGLNVRDGERLIASFLSSSATIRRRHTDVPRYTVSRVLWLGSAGRGMASSKGTAGASMDNGGGKSAVGGVVGVVCGSISGGAGRRAVLVYESMVSAGGRHESERGSETMVLRCCRIVDSCCAV